MKASEFITESPEIEVLLSKEQINTIHQNCGNFLQNATEPLLRGVKKKRQQTGLSKVPIRTNRIPTDLRPTATAAFNYIFELNTGIPYIRNSTAFATNNIIVARGYGVPALTFPIDGTRYVKSDSIKDIFNKIHNDDIDSLEYDYMQTLDSEKESQNFFAGLNGIYNTLLAQDGRLTKDEIDKLFGKHLSFWKMYIKSISSHLDSYKIYDSYNHELTNAAEEIAMFGVSHYYTYSFGLIKMRLQDPKRQIYVGDKKVDQTNIGHEYIVFNAIKNKQEIYATLLEQS